MNPGAVTGCGLFLIFILFVCPGDGRNWKEPSADSAHAGRALLSTYQTLSECQWLPGEGCAADPRFAAYTVNKTKPDPVAQFAAASLSCASTSIKAECQAPYCSWDPTVPDGQQGCSLHPAKLMQLQVDCMQPQYKAAFEELQKCLAADSSCTCKRAGDYSSCQLPLSGSMCQSAVGCWLSALSNTEQDLLQLTSVQLAVMLPQLQVLWVDDNSPMPLLKASDVLGTSGGRRRLTARHLTDIPSLSNPFSDAEQQQQQQQQGSKVVLESGRPTTSNGSGGGPNSMLSGIGQNIPISIDGTVPNSNQATVETDSTLPRTTPTAGTGQVVFESGSYSPAAQPPSAATPAPAPAAPAPAPTAAPAPAPGRVPAPATTPAPRTPAQSNAPPAFWKCVGAAAKKAETTRKWADVDYNNKQLTLDTWLRVIQPVALVDWGAAVLDCYKEQIGSSPPPAGLDVPKAYEAATVALIRGFRGLHTAFNSFMQTAAPARAQYALTGLQDVLTNILPEQIAELEQQYKTDELYQGDAVLQAQAVLQDVRWFLSSAQNLITAQPDMADIIFQSVIGYGVDMTQQILRWLYATVFGGPSAMYKPAAVAPGVLSAAAADVARSVGSVFLSDQGVTTTDPLPQRVQNMLAISLAWSGSAAGAAKATLSARDGLVRNALDGMARSHVVDFWTNRINDAIIARPQPARAAALADASRWQALAAADVNQMQMLISLQQLVQADQLSQGRAPGAAGGTTGVLQTLVGSIYRWLVASAENLSPSTPTTGGLKVLAQSLEAAIVIGQCYGDPSGKGLDKVSADAKTAACKQAQQLLGQVVGFAMPGQPQQVQDLAKAAVQQQWQCNGLGAPACLDSTGCQLALGWAGDATTKPLMMCQMATSQLEPALYLGNSTAGNMGSSRSCSSFLQMPSCSNQVTAADCGKYAVCSWMDSADRAMLRASATAPASAGTTGEVNETCSSNWGAVFGLMSSEAQGSIKAVQGTCRGLGDAASCRALTQTVLIEESSVGAAPKQPSLSVVVPAIVVPVVVVGILTAALLVYRHRRAAAEEEEEEAAGTDSSSGRSSGHSRRKGGKGGGGKKGGAWRKKAAAPRAEPGANRPDLMRDSFTDYLRTAPAQFVNGVALARAAMEAGPGGANEVHGNLIDLREENSGALLLGGQGVGMQQVAGARPVGEAPDTRRASDGGSLQQPQGALQLRRSHSGAVAGSSFGVVGPVNVDASPADMGASNSLARVSMSSMLSGLSGLTGLSRYAPSARGGGGRHGGQIGTSVAGGSALDYTFSDAEDGMSTLSPTSSVCHDSVCTFRHSRPSARGGAAAAAAEAGESAVSAAAAAEEGHGALAQQPAAAAVAAAGPSRQGSQQLPLGTWPSTASSQQELLRQQSSSTPLQPRSDGL